MTCQRTLYIAPLLLAGFLAIAGCDATGPEAETDTSTFRLLLTDAPLDEIAEAHVEIERIELRGTDTTLVLASAPQSFDLLTLQDGITAPLAELDVPDGVYHEVRVVVDEEAYVVFVDGTEERLKVPGGTQSGLKIKLGNLALDSDVVEVTLDFDVSASFVRRGNSGKGYLFKPVIRPLAILVNGEPTEVEAGGDAGGD
ncbi:MAG: DUF4382 domain-containing protein [Rhodothermales bacterium]|nr:DUF4382 domain-containing protein [Rhodothermales bacterium]